MALPPITKRIDKGLALTYQELDDNFTNLDLRAIDLDERTIELDERTIELDQRIQTVSEGGVDLTGFTTDDIAEGDNLYYTVDRANSAIDARVTKSFVDGLNVTTSEIGEGSRKYWTTARGNAAIDARVTKSFVAGLDVSTDDLVEGSNNRFFTGDRVKNTITKEYVDNLNINADELDGLNSSQFLRSDTADALNAGRGPVYIENHAFDNADGAGLTLRTSDNPSDEGGAIFAVRSSGDAVRFWVGQKYTSTGQNPLLVGTGNDGFNDPHIYLPTSGDPTVGGNKIWHEGNMGPGSNLNADKLDGLQASQFLRLGMDNTVTGQILFDTETNNKPVLIGRNGSDSNEVLQIGVEDTTASFRYVEDTTGEGTGNFGNFSFYLAGDSGESDVMAFRITKNGAQVLGNDVYHTGNANFLSSTDPIVTRGYFEIKPYNSGYDDGSFFQTYYDGTNRTLQIQARDETNTTTDVELQINSNKIWHSGNDGSGSNLNADKLDGLHASQFMRSDANNDISGGSINNIGRLDFGAGDHAEYETTTGLKIFENGTHTATIGPNSWFLNKVRFDEYIDGLQINAYQTNSGRPAGKFIKAQDVGNMSPVLIVAGDGESDDILAEFRSNSTGKDVDSADDASSNDWQHRFWGGGDFSAKGKIYANGNNEVWHSGNDGSGTGLDADKLDGYHHTGFLKANAENDYIDFKNYESTDFSQEGRLFYDASVGMYISASNAKHSNPAALWSSANFTAGSDLSVSYDSEDMPTLSVQSSTNDSDNTIAKRNGNGDIYARLFRSTYGTSGISDGADIIMRNDNSGDNYLRPVTAGTFFGWFNANANGLNLRGDIDMNNNDIKEVKAILFGGGFSGDYISHETQVGIKYYENGSYQASFGRQCRFPSDTRVDGGHVTHTNTNANENGSIMFLKKISNGFIDMFDTTYGNNLRVTGTDLTNGGFNLTGTWQALGRCDKNAATLFRRIA